MANAAVMFSLGFCHKMGPPEIEKKTGKMNNSGKIYLTTAAFDIALIVTFLVIGILGLLSLISMPPSAAYTLISLSGVLLTAWIASTIRYKGTNFLIIKDLLGGLCDRMKQKQNKS